MLLSCNDVKKADKLRAQDKFEEAFEIYKKAAEKGDAYAQWRLAQAYLFGDGVETDFDEYEDWLRKAAQNGSEEAKFQKAENEYFGRHGFDKNQTKAKQEIEKLVSKTDNALVLSEYSIALIGGGSYVEKDKDKAYKTLQRVKDKEDSQYNLAMAIFYCLGSDKVEINYNKVCYSRFSDR